MSGADSMAATADDPARIGALLDQALEIPIAREVAAPFWHQLVPPGRGVRAVLLYGSTLWKSLRGAGSHPDFIVVVDSLRAYGGLASALLGAVLPPLVYRLQSGNANAKVSVVTRAQLSLYCSESAPDLHLLGRLSKRVALVWASDADARSLVVDAQWTALEILAKLALSRLGSPAHVDEFMKVLLGLSYEAEVRIAEPHKVTALFEVERAHYRAIACLLLAHFGALRVGDGLRFHLPAGVASRSDELARRLRRSRLRAVLRWPKYLCTYDGWLDYLLAKLARGGAPVSLTPVQRRHPLLFATPVLYRLVKAKTVR